MRLGSDTWPPTQSAMPQERNESVSLRSKTWTCQSGCAARIDWVAKVPAWVQPTTATVRAPFLLSGISASPLFRWRFLRPRASCGRECGHSRPWPLRFNVT